jgi:hypothetical protein
MRDALYMKILRREGSTNEVVDYRKYVEIEN